MPIAADTEPPRIAHLALSQGDAWSERGVCNLQLRRPQADATGSPRLLCRNDTGKLTLNAKVYAGLKVQVKQKSVLMKLANALPADDGAQAADVPFVLTCVPTRSRLHDCGLRCPSLHRMLRVKTEAEAEKLAALISEQQLGCRQQVTRGVKLTALISEPARDECIARTRVMPQVRPSVPPA